MTKNQVQPPLKPCTAWALSNWGYPWGTYRTRREAIEEAVTSTGKPWKMIRDHFAVTKVQVTPL